MTCPGRGIGQRRLMSSVILKCFEQKLCEPDSSEQVLSILNNSMTTVVSDGLSVSLNPIVSYIGLSRRA
jgi:hypothetical protein